MTTPANYQKYKELKPKTIPLMVRAPRDVAERFEALCLATDLARWEVIDFLMEVLEKQPKVRA